MCHRFRVLVFNHCEGSGFCEIEICFEEVYVAAKGDGGSNTGTIVFHAIQCSVVSHNE